LDIGRMTCELG